MKEKIKKWYNIAGAVVFTIGGILGPIMAAGIAEDNGSVGWPFFVLGYALVIPFIIQEYKEWNS
jgi:MFS family permease